ncbi:ATP-binding response regulator [Solimicrobium silvestre]|nr:hybrid sensor histidine kinase/response regulator [Solimicrobium silvestre]
MFSLVSALTVLHERNRMFNSADMDAHKDVNDNASVIAHDLWEFDNAALKASLKGLALSGSIIRAEVFDGDKVVATFSRLENTGSAEQADKIWAIDLMAPDDSKKIGSLRITESYAELRAVMANNVLAVIASELTKVGVLAAILFIIVHQLLTRHLKSLAHEIETANTLEVGSASTISLHRNNRRRDELDTLVDAINRFRQERAIAEQQTVLLARLSAQKEAAEVANRAKSRFLAAASHDLRQPIHALHLFLGTLKNLDLPLQAQRPLANVLRCTESIDEMFVSLLDVAKFDAGLIEPQISDFPIMTVLNRIRHECTLEANAKGLRLDVVPNSAWIRSDPLMVERILRNLVSNSIRYTASGKILVGCRRRPGNTLELAVYDTGIGIASDQQEKIFGEFYKAGFPDIGQPGLGLGLSIVDQLSKLLSAPLKLSSSEGMGSMFSVTFNLAQNTGIEHPPARPFNGNTNFDGCTVLVIDDDAAILEATRGLLEQWGCHVIIAEGINSAIKLLMQEAQLPNAMICDYRLRSKENGANAVAIICEEFNADIPAMLITADTSPTRIVQLKATGLPVLHKPLRDNELKIALTQLLFPSATPHFTGSKDSNLPDQTTDNVLLTHV